MHTATGHVKGLGRMAESVQLESMKQEKQKQTRKVTTE
jgi:hypothetical protein